jgi:pre-mRNA-processing factor 17
VNPLLSDHHKAPKNTLTGFVEGASFNDFQFDNQRKTFQSYGYAVNPSGEGMVGNISEAANNKMTTVFETRPQRPKDKRRHIRNDDPSDVDGFLGPWAHYKDQELVSRPTEEQQKEIDIMLAKRKKRTRFSEKPEEENRSTLHIDDPYDYLGRSFLHIPQDVGKNLRSQDPPDKCYIPKKIVHTYTGHTKGIQKMELFPVSGHLFLTCSMDAKVKVKLEAFTFLKFFNNSILFYLISFGSFIKNGAVFERSLVIRKVSAMYRSIVTVHNS